MGLSRRDHFVEGLPGLFFIMRITFFVIILGQTMMESEPRFVGLSDDQDPLSLIMPIMLIE